MLPHFYIPRLSTEQKLNNKWNRKFFLFAKNFSIGLKWGEKTMEWSVFSPYTEIFMENFLVDSISYLISSDVKKNNLKGQMLQNFVQKCK